MHYNTGLYYACCKEKIAVDEAIFWSTAQDELKKDQEFCWKYPLLSLPFFYFLSL